MLPIFAACGRATERSDMQVGKQTKQINIEKGLVLVRYVAAEDEKRPPQVKILVNPKHRQNIELLLTPDDREPILWQPGSSLIAKAIGPGQLFVEVTPIETGGSAAATVKFEVLTQGRAVRLDRNLHAKSHRLNILGHVAGLGDVMVREDEWIAGPDAPSRIEGLAIDWLEKPEDVELHYSVKLARPHAVSGRVSQLREFAGTRGRAMPILGVTLELTGPGASNFQLSGEATFLGSPLTRVTGGQIAIAGPTGREALVGFRLRLEQTDSPLHSAAPVAAPIKSSSRVRVFRPQSVKNRLSSISGTPLDWPQQRQV